MGTHADFYVGRGKDAEWFGSIGWDGYPSSIPDKVLQSVSEQGYRDAVENFLQSRDDATLPKDGWPWPWDNSCTTNYVYAFEVDKVYAAHFGHSWFIATGDRPDDESNSKECIFPDMSTRKNVTFGRGSGLIIVSGSQHCMKADVGNSPNNVIRRVTLCRKE